MEYYLRIGRASDLKNKKERIFYRFLEMFPGLVSWTILFLIIFLSWKQPFWISIFIMVFVIFWFLRTIYFSVHLWSGYQKMSENEKTDWMSKLNGISNWRDIYQLVVVPMYDEPLAVIKDCFNSLDECDYPNKKMIVVLGCEERAKDKVQASVEQIEKEFGNKFFKFMITWHPNNLEGEISGKGSNETWATKMAKEKIIDPLKIPYEKIIFSPFDVDTVVYPKYFSILTYRYLTTEKPTRTSFQPIPLYTNNIWQAPAFSKIFAFSSTFWHTMNQGRPEKLITFSSHSMSFKALVEVNFKQTNVVSDDSRIFWQCFLQYDGDYRVEPLYYPISMDANVAKSFFRTLYNIFKQQRRWAYGVADIAYFLFGFSKNKKIPFKKKLMFTI